MARREYPKLNKHCVKNEEGDEQKDKGSKKLEMEAERKMQGKRKNGEIRKLILCMPTDARDTLDQETKNRGTVCHSCVRIIISSPKINKQNQCLRRIPDRQEFSVLETL